MKAHRLSIAITLLSAIGLSAAEPRTLHVAPGGGDGASGEAASPLRTIQKAAEVARAGDTVLVRGGVYTGLLLLRHSGEPDRPITFKNAPGEKPVVDGEGRGRIELQAEDGWQKPIGWINVEGFEVRNGWDGIKFYNAHHIVLAGNFIHDNLNQGILGNGHHVRIEGNTIAHNGFKADNEKSNKEHGIYGTGTDFDIIGNVIHSNRAYGIQVAAYPYKADSHAGPEFASARRWRIRRNTIAFEENRGAIVVWQEGAAGCVIERNIFYKNAVRQGGGDCQGIDFAGAGGGHVIRGNLFFAPGRASIAGKPEGYAASENLEGKDPLFLDADRFDFRLREGSPAVGLGASGAAGGAAPATGPLRVHPQNPRYFTDGTTGPAGSPRVVYLTGSHHWNCLQDSAKVGKPLGEKFDYDGYLDFLEKHHHNLIRLWSWEVGENDACYAPAAWSRPGPGTATDGQPKFDLQAFNPEFFERLRSRVIAARDRGIYVSVMLFQGWSIYSHGYGNPWPIHPFNKANNTNGIDGDADHDGEGKEVHRLTVPAVTRAQEAYLRKVIDTVNDLDNVLYEITNETEISSREWQYHIVRFIKEYEAGKARRHPVGMTAFDSGREGSMAALLASPADWISPQNDGASGDYKNDPPAADGRKVILSDTDHLWGTGGDRVWVWKSFTRGLQPIYMDPLKGPDVKPEMEGARKAMGDARRFADRMNLAAMTPRGELASTGYCLADPGGEYLVFQPTPGKAFTVDLKPGTYRGEWFDAVKGAAAGAGEKIESAGGSREFKPPVEGGAVLYLEAQAK
jgi:parallel beta helix pectate lyase-like protein